MTIKKIDILLFLIFGVIVSFGMILNSSFLAAFFVILTYVLISLIVEKSSSVHMMFFVGFSTFIFLPTILNWYYLNTNTSLFFLSSIVAFLFLFLTKNTKVKEFHDYGNFIRIFYFISCSLVIFASILRLSSFVAATMAFLIILLSLSFKKNNIKNNIFYLIIFIITFFSYMLFSWEGFGRTVVFGWLLLALLQFFYSINININKYLFALFPGVGATLLVNRDILNLKFTGIEEVLDDSAYSPYRLASTFINSYQLQGMNIIGFFDQILYTFFIFIPRAIWPEKPYGFGFEYTVRHYTTALIDAGHSIAATLIGEHIYYLGYWGLITALIIFSFIAWIINFFYKIKGLNGNGVLIFSASMMVLVWGGMTSFSSRIALPTIIFLILYFCLRRFLFNKTRIKWGN
jgi:hypothetical protein